MREIQKPKSNVIPLTALVVLCTAFAFLLYQYFKEYNHRMIEQNASISYLDVMSGGMMLHSVYDSVPIGETTNSRLVTDSDLTMVNKACGQLYENRQRMWDINVAAEYKNLYIKVFAQCADLGKKAAAKSLTKTEVVQAGGKLMELGRETDATYRKPFVEARLAKEKMEETTARTTAAKMQEWVK